jgi:Na+/H+ antiporter
LVQEKYVGEMAKETINPMLLPVLIFLISAILSFAIGSSWGTIIIIMPLAIPSAISTGNEFAIIIGAVLSGSLFGDHSSPLSETTILSSTGAGIDPLSHFSTQLPYALTNGAIAAIGFVLAGFFTSNFIVVSLILFQLIILLILRHIKYSYNSNIFT